MEKLSIWLRDKRASQKMDVRELSLVSQVTTAQISRIENQISSITVNALIRLAYGLDFEIKDVLKTVGIPLKYSLLRKTNIKKRADVPIPSIEEAYAIWQFYRDEPQKAKALIYDGYSMVELKLGRLSKEELPFAFDAAWKALQTNSFDHNPLEFPPEIEYGHFAEIVSCKGVVTKRDFGTFVEKRRMELGLSQKDLEGESGVSQGVISRLENGMIDRLLFENILNLDKVLDMHGELVLLAWHTGEYESGVSLLRYKNKADFKDRKIVYQEWESEAKAWADAFVAISRWHYTMSIQSHWWAEVQGAISFYTGNRDF
jgi:transcriptional regulator with XRE-family HTH domain